MAGRANLIMKLKTPAIEGEINKEDYDFLQKFAGSDLLGLLGGDWIKLWRWNNLINIAGRVRRKCEESNLDPNRVSPKFLSQFFEESSLEENEILQEMWANLLVNRSVNPSTNNYYITILSPNPSDTSVCRIGAYVYEEEPNPTSSYCLS
ncbi:hypothetical protein IPP75_05880 [Candidatus Saccharibacteria bacterium]|nr:MAG: hypothetical protein IPP75_05880 [Candidatus Saccharibacteria bacterium]